MFSIFRETLFQQTQFESQFRFLNEWASLDAIAKRLNYVPKEPFPKAKEST